MEWNYKIRKKKQKMGEFFSAGVEKLSFWDNPKRKEITTVKAGLGSKKIDFWKKKYEFER